MLAAQDTHPWIAPISAIIGVVIGAVFGVLGAWWADARRWRREDQTRWIDVQRLSVAKFLVAAGNDRTALSEALLSFPEDETKRTGNEFEARVSTYEALLHAYQECALVCATRIVAELGRVMDTAKDGSQLVQDALDGKSKSITNIEAVSKAFNQAMGSVLAAAREELLGHDAAKVEVDEDS